MARLDVTLPRVQTTDATPKSVIVTTLAPSSAARLMAMVVARTAGGDVKAWRASRTGQRIGAAAPTLVGTAPAAEIENTAGAAAWTLAVGVSGNSVVLTYTGAVGTTIEWDADVIGTVNA